jgi:hypothetical protein
MIALLVFAATLSAEAARWQAHLDCLAGNCLQGRWKQNRCKAVRFLWRRKRERWQPKRER